MNRKLEFKEVVRSKAGSTIVQIVAEHRDLSLFKDKEGVVVTRGGKNLTGAETYDDFRRHINKHYFLTSVSVRIGNHVFSVPKKDFELVTVTYLGKSTDPEQRVSGTKVISSGNSNEIKVVLAGGYGAAGFIKTWIFDSRRGFVKSELEGPL